MFYAIETIKYLKTVKTIQKNYKIPSEKEDTLAILKKIRILVMLNFLFF